MEKILRTLQEINTQERYECNIDMKKVLKYDLIHSIVSRDKIQRYIFTAHVPCLPM